MVTRLPKFQSNALCYPICAASNTPAIVGAICTERLSIIMIPHFMLWLLTADIQDSFAEVNLGTL